MKKIGVRLIWIGAIALVFCYMSSFLSVFFEVGLLYNIPFVTPLAWMCLMAGIALLVINSISATLRPHNPEGYLLAVGEVIDVRETGLVVNGKPKVKVGVLYATQEGRLINAEISECLEYGTIEELKPHTAVVLRYDPSDTQKLVFESDANPLAFNKAKHIFLMATGVLGSHEIDIVENGVKTRGIVMTSKATDQMVGHRRIWELCIMVENPGGSSYKAYAERAILSEQEVYVVPGGIVKVYHMPDKEEDIVVGFFVEEDVGGVMK